MSISSQISEAEAEYMIEKASARAVSATSSSILMEEDRFSSYLSRLSDEIAFLEDKVRMVSMANDSDTNGTTPAQAPNLNSPVANSLWVNNERFFYLMNRLNEVINRIDL